MDGLSFLHKKVVYRHFSNFNMASKLAAEAHVNIFIIIGSNEWFICALWSPAGKGLTSWLSFVVSSVSLSLSNWYPGSGVVLDCIDS